MEPLTGKRRQPAFGLPPLHSPCTETNKSCKKRRFESSTEEKQSELRRPEPEKKKVTFTANRQRRVSPETQAEEKQSKDRRVEQGTPPSPVLPTSDSGEDLVAACANLDNDKDVVLQVVTHAVSETAATKMTDARTDATDVADVVATTEALVSAVESTAQATGTVAEEEVVDEVVVDAEEVSESLKAASCCNADIVTVCAVLDYDVSCCQDAQRIDMERTTQRTSVQVTPPPSTRMLDRKNPPPPPKRPKRQRNYGGSVDAQTPPSSRRVCRSLGNEFALTVQATRAALATYSHQSNYYR